MSYKPFTTHQQRRELLLKVPSGKARLLLRAVLSDLNRAEILLSTRAVRDALEKMEAAKAVAAIRAGDCDHKTWAWKSGGSMQRYCTKCGQNLPQDLPLERSHRPYADCGEPSCEQCDVD
jgi:hypothetical protein